MQKAIDTGLKGGSSLFLYLLRHSICSTSGLSNPVPVACDRHGDKSYCGGGDGCEKKISSLNYSTLTFISNIYSSESGGHRELYNPV